MQRIHNEFIDVFFQELCTFKAHYITNEEGQLTIPKTSQEGRICTPGTTQGAVMITEAANNSNPECG